MTLIESLVARRDELSLEIEWAECLRNGIPDEEMDGLVGEVHRIEQDVLANPSWARADVRAKLHLLDGWLGNADSVYPDAPRLAWSIADSVRRLVANWMVDPVSEDAAAEPANDNLAAEVMPAVMISPENA